MFVAAIRRSAFPAKTPIRARKKTNPCQNPNVIFLYPYERLCWSFGRVVITWAKMRTLWLVRGEQAQGAGGFT
jgi:hypothetical protein